MNQQANKLAKKLTLGICFSGLSMASCGPSDFSPETLINTVRVMGSKASEPYASPGDNVDLEVLAYDGRPEKAEPMKIYWLPFTCENPASDAYYGCFTSIFSGGAFSGDGGTVTSNGDAGAGLGGLTALQPGVDLSNFLPTGPRYSLTVPPDAITSHPVVAGSTAPYGLVIVFNMACAGHVQLLARDSSNPQAVPIGCFDENGNQLTPDDYVFGYTRVYAYAADGGVSNANPVLTDVRVGAQTIDTQQGFTVDAGTTIDVDTDVPLSDWELVPDTQSNGAPLHETVYAEYFVTLGKIDDQVRILYDSVQGKVSPTNTKFEAPDSPQDGFMWIIIHDNRDGATWVQIPVHVQ
jgi:hypothetical protein